MKIIPAIAMLATFFSTNVWAHSGEKNIKVEIQAKNVEQRSTIAKIIHLDSILEDRIFSVVSQYDLDQLKANNVSVISEELISADVSSAMALNANSIEFPPGEEKFHTYQELSDLLEEWEDDAFHPNVAYEKFSIGKSVEGREIWVMRISDGNDDGAEKPAIVYTGTHHAREHVSTEIPIMFANYLLSESLTNETIQNLLSKVDIYIIPMVNPDGAMHDIKGRRYKWWRKNRSTNPRGSYGVDLNRNYGFGWGTGGSSRDERSDVFMGPSPFSEPETKAIRDFLKDLNNLNMVLSFHTFSELILYPWGGRSAGVGGDDERAMVQLAEEMAQMNNYRPMQSSDLYIASGDTCDWVYGELDTFCFTFELSPSSMWDGGFYPGAGVIDRVFDDNLAPMIYLAEQTPDPLAVLEN